MRVAAVLLVLMLAGCGAAPPATPTAEPTLAPLPRLELGAGFRYSSYGIGPNDPGPAYWQDVGVEMASRFDGATPQAIWIVGSSPARERCSGSRA